MAEIKLDDLEAINNLREIVGEDLFPFRDYDPSDPNVTISITLYKKDANSSPYKYGSKEFTEEEFGKLPEPIRSALVQELWRMNSDNELIEKLKMLGVTIKFPATVKKRTWL